MQKIKVFALAVVSAGVTLSPVVMQSPALAAACVGSVVNVAPNGASATCTSGSGFIRARVTCAREAGGSNYSSTGPRVDGGRAISSVRCNGIDARLSKSFLLG